MSSVPGCITYCLHDLRQTYSELVSLLQNGIIMPAMGVFIRTTWDSEHKQNDLIM